MPLLSPDELARYGRHLQLAEIGLAGQEKLKSSRVLVLGAGGLGSPAALYLAAAGVGTLGLADFDTVALHNLQRQLLHSDATVGQPKTDSAAARLHATNPHVHVVLHREALDAGNAERLFASYDVVVDGTDNFPTRYLASDAAVLTRRPLVYGSVYKFEGQVSVFAPHLGGPCQRCLFPEPPDAGAVPNCGEAGVLGALCGVIGSLQALEAIKLITGAGAPALGRLLTFDALSFTFATLTLPRDPHCPACGSSPSLRSLEAARYAPTCSPSAVQPSRPSVFSSMSATPLEISVEETKQLLDSAPADTVLIDVREPHEVRICAIPGARHIPMRQIPENVSALPRDKHLLVHCHHGGRSLRVTEFLRAQGFTRVSNVAGGIDAWAATFDPSMLRY